MYKNILMNPNTDTNTNTDDDNNTNDDNNILNDDNNNYLVGKAFLSFSNADEKLKSNKFDFNSSSITTLNLYNNNRWLDEKIDSTRYFNNLQYENQTNLYLSNYNNICYYYYPNDIEIKQKYYYYDIDRLNIYSHPSNKVLKEDKNAIIYVGINNKTRRFYVDNIFRKLIDICIKNNIKDPLTNEYLINKSHRKNFYIWSRKNS